MKIFTKGRTFLQNIYINFLKEKIADNTGITIDNINTDINIFENNYIDSIGIFTLLVEIEEEYGIEISLNSIEDIDTLTINSLSKIIEYERSNN